MQTDMQSDNNMQSDANMQTDMQSDANMQSDACYAMRARCQQNAPQHPPHHDSSR
jgi:hypothetical protein